MPPAPLRNPATGGYNCPRCGTSLVQGLAQFNLRGEYVGRFPSVVCTMCGYSALTASGYDSAMETARLLGLVGLPEESGEVSAPSQSKKPLVITVQQGRFQLEERSSEETPLSSENEIMPPNLEQGDSRTLRVPPKYKNSANEMP